MKKRILAISAAVILAALFFPIHKAKGQTGYTTLFSQWIQNSLIDSTPIGSHTPSTGAFTSLNATSFTLNGAAPTGHQLCGNGTSYVDTAGQSCSSTTQIDYYWTSTNTCSTGTGQPVHCETTTTLPGNMPDANYTISCQVNVQSFSGTPPDGHCSLNTDYPLPTASGSTITWDAVQTMQNGGGGAMWTAYFHAHHN